MSEPADRPDEVMKKARWEANNACIDANAERDREGRGYLTPAEMVTLTIETAAPVLIEAERERIGAGIRSLRLNAPAWPKDDSYEAGLEAALSVIDKEGGEA